MKKRSTTVVTLAATKGGVGKTMLTAAFAVRAAEEARKVAMIDLDPQETLSNWVDRRENKKNPKLFEMDAATEAIELLVSEGWRWVFIDTSPAKLEIIEPGIAVADFVLIPLRPSASDFEQIKIVVDLCREHKKPFAFALNHAPPNAVITKATAQLISQFGPVLKPYLPFRQAHMDATVLGKVAFEHGKGDAVRAEIDELWEALKAAIDEQG